MTAAATATVTGRRAVPFLFLAVAAAFVPYRELLTSKVPVARDLPFYFYPLKAHLGQALRSGQVPWIDPTRWGGVALLGAPGAAAFYPANILFVLLPVGPAMKVWILLHLALAVVGFASFAGRLGLSRKGAALSGLLFGLGGLSVSLVPFCGAFSSWALLPWFASAILDLGESPTRRVLVRTALLAALILLAGVPEFALYALVIGAALLVRRGPSLLRSLGAGSLAALLAAILAAPQLLPTISAALGSTRGPGGGMNEVAAGEKSLAPARLVELLSDGVLADWTQVAGTKAIPEYPYLPSITPGRIAILLALAGLSVAGRGRFAAALLVALGIGLALGPPSFVWRAAARAVPFFVSLRFPEKHLVLAGFGFAWLAALGLRVVERHEGAKAGLIAGLLALAILVDRERTARRLLMADSGTCLTKAPPLLKPVLAAKRSDLPLPRIFHRDSYAPVPAFDTEDLLGASRTARAALDPSYASLFGAAYIFEPDYDLGLPREAVEWNRLLAKSAASGLPIHDQILRGAGVAAVLGSVPAEGGRFVPLLRPFRDPLPPFRFVSRVHFDSDGRRLFKRFLDGGAEPDAAWVVRPNGPPDLGVPRGRVIEVRDRPEGLSLDVDVPGPGDAFLALFRLHAAAEEATLDERPLKVEEMTFGFAGVFVPPGRHRLLFRPFRAPVRWGLGLSALGVLLLAAAWGLPRHATPRFQVDGAK